MSSTTPTLQQEGPASPTREDEALVWLVRLRRPELSEQDTREFASWLGQHPDNPAASDRAAELWELTAALPSETGVSAATSRSSRPLRARHGFALAATVLLGAVGLSFVLSGDETFQTDEGEQLQVTLEDGSRVWLNTASEIASRVDAGGSRQVTLVRGEAFFDIAPDARHPFTIDSGDVRVVVLGTRFNVWNDGNQTRVDVESGQVQLDVRSSTGQRDTTRLQSGQSAEGDASGIHVSTASESRLDRWREGRLVYDNVSLGELVADLDRYVPGALALADDDLANLEVSAVLQLGDSDSGNQNDMLDALAAGLDLTWSDLPGDLKLITRKPLPN